MERVMHIKYIHNVVPPHQKTLLRNIPFPKGVPEPEALPAHFSPSPHPQNP